MTDYEKFCAVLDDLKIFYSVGVWENGLGNTLQRVRLRDDLGGSELRFNFIDGNLLDIE